MKTRCCLFLEFEKEMILDPLKLSGDGQLFLAFFTSEQGKTTEATDQGNIETKVICPAGVVNFIDSVAAPD